MARLPQPGGDAGNWGDILNDYLSQSHKADGTINDNAVTSNTLAPNSVTSAKLANDAVSKSQLAPALRTELDTKITQATADTTYASVLAAGWKQTWFGGALRNMGAAGGYWQMIDDGAHWPWNIDRVETNTISIDVYYDFQAAGIGSVLVSTDETMSAHGWQAGASVEGNKCSIKLNRHRTIADQIRYDGTTWVSTTGLMNASWSSASGGQLILTHPRVYGHSYTITNRGPLIANLSTVGPADPFVETRVMFYDLATGAQVATPNTNMRVYVTRSDANNGAAINPQAVPDQTELPNSNLWIFGVHHTGPRPVA